MQLVCRLDADGLLPFTVFLTVLVMALIAGATSHRLLSAETGLAGRELSEDAVERQRILAELEEVHQLRERMLQEGGEYSQLVH